MRKFVCILLVALSLCSLALAEDGVFVPSFNVFMDRFSTQVQTIDHAVYDSVMEAFWVDNAWFIPEYNFAFSSRKPKIDLNEVNGFLKSAKITISKDYFEENKEIFKALMLAAATSICEVNQETFYEDIYFDYVVESPAGYISMYYNSGVYLFDLTKSSRDMELEISLSLYNPN